MGNLPPRAEALTDAEAASVLANDCSVKAIAEYIAGGRAKNIVVLVGAGVSVSAGIPDFRTPGTGLYDNLQKYNLPSPQAIFEIGYFQQHPEAFYQLAKEMWPGQFTPTPAHFFIRLLHEKGLLKRCFTQNIDSLESRAGIPLDKIVAAHGNFDSATCIATGQKVPMAEVQEAVCAGRWQDLRDKYGGLVKPDIVFFGESLPPRFAQLRQTDFLDADLVLVMGTSLKVQPFASLVWDAGKVVPRLLINRELVGERTDFEDKGFRFGDPDNYRDVALLTDCDNGVQVLATLLGWQDELAALVRAEAGRDLPGPVDLPVLSHAQWRASGGSPATPADAEYFCAVRPWRCRTVLEVEWHCRTDAPDTVKFVACLAGDTLVAAQAGGLALDGLAASADVALHAVPAADGQEGKATLEVPEGAGTGPMEVWLVGTAAAPLQTVHVPAPTPPAGGLAQAMERLDLRAASL